MDFVISVKYMNVFVIVYIWIVYVHVNVYIWNFQTVQKLKLNIDEDYLSNHYIVSVQHYSTDLMLG